MSTWNLPPGVTTNDPHINPPEEKLDPPKKKTTIITLRARPARGVDATPRIVVLTRETDTDYWGYPLANPKCPVLQWPKFAWVKA